MVVCISFQQRNILPHISVIPIGILVYVHKRRSILCIDPEKGTGRPLEESGNVKTGATERETETVDDFRNGRKTDRHLVQFGNLSVTVYIPVFDITRPIFAKGLLRRVGHIGIVNEQTLGNITEFLI